MRTYIKMVCGKWHAFAASGNTVYSIEDFHRCSGRFDNFGIMYVSKSYPDKIAAEKSAKENGEYMGVIS